MKRGMMRSILLLIAGLAGGVVALALVATVVIYLMGEPARRFYVVAAGQVKLMRHTLGGQDVLRP